VIEALVDLMVMKGDPENIRSNSGMPANSDQKAE
jgi:hypothetical protein